MLAEKRRQQILDLINQTPREAIQVIDLAEQFDVSAMTIRRDLENLQKLGFLHRVHGGAVSRMDGLETSPYTERRKEFSRAKAQIGALAAQLIKDNDQIILDSGTTTLQIARNLARRHTLTIVTNSISISNVLSHISSARIIVLGGELNMEEDYIVGSVATQQVSQYSVDKAFISTSGFSLAKGATDVYFPEVEVKQAMMRAARQVILVADSSKWQVERLIRIAEIQAFHKIITDDGFPQSGIDALQARQIEVITPRIGFPILRPTMEE
jgi:DeoR/GlpR family transcriptional regulator of sugar metabolism